jgi:hypothetical protein
LIRRRHAIPCTVTSSGHVSQHPAPLLAGPTEALRGLARYRELHARLRQQYGKTGTAMLMLAAWRYGFVFSG